MKIRTFALSGAIGALAFSLLAQAQTGTARNLANTNLEWAFHGSGASDRYSPATGITPANVTGLAEAWRFPMAAGGLQTQPIMIDRTVFAVTTDRKVVALDAASGQLKWTFDPQLEGTQPIRGLATWRGNGRLRIIFGREQYLHMIDAETGRLVPGFGTNGRIDARENLRGRPEDNKIYLTSPAQVFENLIIVNGRLAENTPASPGDVRAFDARTGRLVWTFHTIPHPGEVGAETWPKDAHLTQGGANAWSGATVDRARGIVFVNTGSAADDFYGARRLGNNRFASSTIALNARTGKRIWDFQHIHHDIWDLDPINAPVLTSITRSGRKVDVAVATNKTSYIYVFNRTTGRPIFPIRETPVPASDVPGEVAARTQPIPTLPRPMARKSFTEKDLTSISAAANAEARKLLANVRGNGQPFTPLGLNRDTLVAPGFSGTWGGMAADRKGVLYATAPNGSGMSRMVDNSRMRDLIGKPGGPTAIGGAQNGIGILDYNFSGYGQFRLPTGGSALDEATSMGTFNAIDLNTGFYKWSIYLPGRANSSGPLVTATGLLFISAGNELQAYDSENGRLLWKTTLSASGGNSPGSYVVDGRQYVILSTGGRGQAAYVAYALPR
jgi:quinoprotein glucose dehydrogenase